VDDLAVDLDERRPQCGDEGEGGVAGARVVDGEAEAGPAQLAHALDEGRLVWRGLLFGALDGDGRGRDAGGPAAVGSALGSNHGSAGLMGRTFNVTWGGRIGQAGGARDDLLGHEPVDVEGALCRDRGGDDLVDRADGPRRPAQRLVADRLHRLRETSGW
jgi:hypothetical protein